DGTLEMRHYIASEELVAVPGPLAVGPFMGAEHHAAKAALTQFDEPLDAFDDGLGRSDKGRAHPHSIAQRIVREARLAAERVLEIGLGLDPLAGPYLARRACSSSSATCMLTTRRQSLRSMR